MNIRQYPKYRWVSGAYKRECDICKFDYLSTELRLDFSNLLVCSRCWDPPPRTIEPYIPPSPIPFVRR